MNKLYAVVAYSYSSLVFPSQSTSIIIATKGEFLSIDNNSYHKDLVTILPHGRSAQEM